MTERILCVIGKLGYGGVESMMLSYYRFLNKDKYQYDFIYEEGSERDIPADLIAMGARAFKVSPISSPFKYVRDVRNIIKREGYRIVHTNVNTLSVFSLFAAKSCKVKYRILHNHSTSSRQEKKRHLMKTVLRPFNVMMASNYCACSELAARWMYGSKRYEEGAVTVFNNGVDCNKFAFDPVARKSIREEFNISDDKTVIGHVGRFCTQKNHRFVIESFAKACEKNNSLVLMLVGDGELFSDVSQFAKELCVYDKIVFTKNRRDVERLYSAFDVFILPSLYEGLPVVAMEACACGLPVYLADTITKECAISDNVHFLSVSDAEAWAEIMNSDFNIDRNKYALDMEKGAYNIRNNVKLLEEYYTNCR